ncbi:histidine phosphatase family protein [Peribacillus sp. SCS-37]|uniref:histidine phosphatase family protein n=1 Tax=Paraperibacillus esterisolvens TaxID=3115296 RepID=UPI0039060BBE
MSKKIYLIRHAKAEGQPFAAPLTSEGRNQAEKLIPFFEGRELERIISSPFIRAVETIRPLALHRGLPIEQDNRLAERVLSSARHDNWKELLKHSFQDMNSVHEGGESNSAALLRAESLLNELIMAGDKPIALVSHGNLSTLMLHYFDRRFGYDELMRMTNPDVFEINVTSESAAIERIWQDIQE